MRLRRWLPALVLGCLLLTFLNGLVVGYGSVWLQFFGDRPGREDYLVSFGGYAAAALVVLVGLASLVRLGVAGWVTILVAVLGALLAVLALVSLSNGLGMDYDFGPYSHWWDGTGGVIFLPWTWLPLVLGLLALLGRGPRRLETARWG